MSKLTFFNNCSKIVYDTFDFFDITIPLEKTVEVNGWIISVLSTISTIIASWKCAQETICKQTCNLLLTQ